MRALLAGSCVSLTVLLSLACGSGDTTPPPATPAATAPAVEDDPMGMPAGEGPVCCEAVNDQYGYAEYSETDGDCAAPLETVRGEMCESICCNFGSSDAPEYELALAGNCESVAGPKRPGEPVADRALCAAPTAADKPATTATEAKPKAETTAKTEPAPAPAPSPKTPMGRPSSGTGSTATSASSDKPATSTKPTSGGGKPMSRPR